MASKSKLYLTAEIPSIGESDSEILYLKLEKEDGEIVFESHFKPCVYLTWSDSKLRLEDLQDAPLYSEAKDLLEDLVSECCVIVNDYDSIRCDVIDRLLECADSVWKKGSMEKIK